MATSNLVLHCGAKPVTAEELKEYRAPPPSGRWYPIAHSRVLEVVKATLQDAGYLIRKEQYGVMRDGGSRFFGTLDLGTPLVSGVTLAVGVRNSVDRSFPLGFCAGQRVFTCDNLAFRSELLVKKKHTLHGEKRFVQAIAGAVGSLTSFQEAEAERIRRFMRTPLSGDLADALILRAYERGVIGAHYLPKVLHEWRNPAYEEFAPRTVWSLFNAFTSALKERAVVQPHAFAVQTMQLNGLLDFRPDTSLSA
jgi:hypothetical protein